MTPERAFLWGLFGSIAIEIVAIIQYYNTGRPFPKRYKQPLFYIVRILLAASGGLLAVAYGIDKPLLAINIGASAPLILKGFSTRGP